MRKFLMCFGIVLLTSVVSAQAYLGTSVSFYNGTGDFNNKGMATIEVGKTWQVLSVGLAVGCTSFSNGNAYTELRSGFTVFSKGIVDVGVNLGVGYVFNSSTSFLTEYGAYGNISLYKNWQLSLFTGTYNFNGLSVSNKSSFTGLGLIYLLE